MRYDATTQAIIDAQNAQPEREWGAEDPDDGVIYADESEYIGDDEEA